MCGGCNLLGREDLLSRIVSNSNEEAGIHETGLVDLARDGEPVIIIDGIFDETLHGDQ
tara:strand:- start:1140 stop:1313 length:174 start_codon:yes stop_codon:yes gene_type:complete